MFELGQKIIYPMHGIGIIEAIEEGYYMIRIPHGEVQIRIPFASAERIGLRPLLERKELEQLLKETGPGSVPHTENWNLRYKENILRLQSGRWEQAAEVVKLLQERGRKKKLSAVENRLLAMARQIVLSEIISVYEINGREAEELLAKWIKIG